MSVTKELKFGYTTKDKDETVTHKRVTFGKRPTASDLIRITNDQQSNLGTQLSLMLARAAITEFGTLKLPVPLSVLLALNKTDRNILLEGYAEFLSASLGDRTSEALSDDTVRLAFGFEIDGAVYDVVTFGAQLTGYDESAFDRQKAAGYKRLCLQLGKEITRLAQSKGDLTLEGSLDIEAFTSLDGYDLDALSAAEDRWLDSFR